VGKKGVVGRPTRWRIGHVISGGKRCLGRRWPGGVGGRHLVGRCEWDRGIGGRLTI
jgi:hypothetical protein